MVTSFLDTRCFPDTSEAAALPELTKTTRNFLAMALTAARNSTYRHKHGAVVVAAGRVRGVGWSKARNRPANVSDEHLKLCSTHAEDDALRGLGPLRRGTAFVARIDAIGQATLAKPCDACWEKLRSSGITRVYWTVSPDMVGMDTM